MILERYIAGNLVKGWLLVLLVLAAVFGLISFIAELERTRFDYDALAVGRYTLYTLPHQLVGLAPVIALLGSIVALANLDRFNELTIISCTGFSRSRLLLAIAMPTALMMIFLWACMEYITPPLHQSAETERHALRYRNEVRIPDGGVWSKNGNRYIHLDKMLKGGIPGRAWSTLLGRGGRSTPWPTSPASSTSSRSTPRSTGPRRRPRCAPGPTA